MSSGAVVNSISSIDATCESNDGLKQDSLSTGIAFMLLVNVGQRAVGFIRNLSFCRLLDDGSLGLWALASSFFILAAPLSVLGLPGTFGKLVESYRSRGELNRFLKRVFCVCSVSVTLFLAALLVGHNTAGAWILGESVSVSTMAAIALTLLSVILFNTSTELLNSLRRNRIVSKMHTVNSLSFTALSLVGLYFVADWRVIVIAFALSSLIGILPGIPHLRDAIYSNTPQEVTTPRSVVFWKRIIPFAVSIWVMNLLTNMFDIVDRYMLLYLAESHEIGTGLVGQFHSARILPVLLSSLTLMLSSLLLPYMAADWESGKRTRVTESVQVTLKLAMLFFFSLSVGALVIAPYLFDILLEGKYSNGLKILPMALAHCCWIACATLLQNYFWCIEKGRVVGFILAAGLLCNILLNSAMVPRYGISGAMMATTVSGGMILATTLWALRKQEVSLDTASIAVSFLPFCLALSPSCAMIALTIIVVLASRTEWILQGEEKGRIDAAVLPLLSKFGVRLPSLWYSP